VLACEESLRVWESDVGLEEIYSRSRAMDTKHWNKKNFKFGKREWD